MQGYVPGPDGAFAQSRECYAELEEWLASEDAAGLQHGELEEQLDVRGRELLRRLYQDRLDLMAAREVRRHDVTGEDGIPRTRAEKGRTRPLVTKFGQVTVSRIAYRVPGRPNVHPLDAELNLPEEKHSHGLRKLAAIESARGSIEAAGAAGHPRDRRDDRETAAGGIGPPLRRARGGLLHVPRDQPGPGQLAAGADLRREGHRDAAGRAAPRDREGRRRGGGQARHEAVARGEERPQAHGRAGLRLRRRPGPAHPRRHHQHAGTEEKEEESAGQQIEDEGEGQAARAAGAGQVADRLGHRRHPRRHHRRLRRGRTPRPAAQARTGRPHRRQQHPDRGRDRRGRAPQHHRHDRHRLHPRARIPVEGRLVLLDKGEPAAEEWVAAQARTILRGKAAQVAAGIRRRATTYGYSPAGRAGADECARYLGNKKNYLDYATALAKGWPIATGIIEGACRHLVKDRMDITGARWGLEGAEAILRLRAVIATGDFEDYWRFHLRREHERIHHVKYSDGLVLAA